MRCGYQKYWVCIFIYELDFLYSNKRTFEITYPDIVQFQSDKCFQKVSQKEGTITTYRCIWTRSVREKLQNTTICIKPRYFFDIRIQNNSTYLDMRHYTFDGKYMGISNCWHRVCSNRQPDHIQGLNIWCHQTHISRAIFGWEKPFKRDWYNVIHACIWKALWL